MSATEAVSLACSLLALIGAAFAVARSIVRNETKIETLEKACDALVKNQEAMQRQVHELDAEARAHIEKTNGLSTTLNEIKTTMQRGFDELKRMMEGREGRA